MAPDKINKWLTNNQFDKIHTYKWLICKTTRHRIDRIAFIISMYKAFRYVRYFRPMQFLFLLKKLWKRTRSIVTYNNTYYDPTWDYVARHAQFTELMNRKKCVIFFRESSSLSICFIISSRGFKNFKCYQKCLSTRTVGCIRVRRVLSPRN